MMSTNPEDTRLPTMTASGDFLPTASADALRLRARLLGRIRAFFERQGLLEVETPLLSADVVVDRHLDPLETSLERGASRQRLFLQTSPEFGMKRLLAAGVGSIYQITRAFRQGEIGPRHNPEFTMVEWYRVGDDYQAGMGLLAALADELFDRGGVETITYRAAFIEHVGVDPHRASVEQLASAGRARGLTPPESFPADDPDPWRDWLLTELVEPHLGRTRPTIVCDYPGSQAALACVRREDVELAERFELYVEGVELANGYHELLDAAALRDRQRRNNALRLLDGKPCLPEENRLLNAMESGLPACSGTALGFDRVVMLLAGARTIQNVLAFPIDRA